MHFSKAIVLAAASTASAATIAVDVGKGGLMFSPNDIKASIGDQVVFSFFPKNHSVTQSSFQDPCHPLANGFFSTFQPTTSQSANTFTVDVTTTKPIWFYCGQTTGNHCQSGMVGAINAPATGNTLEAFTISAKNATTSTSPPGGVAGGVLAAASSSNSTSSGTESSSSVVTTTVLSTVTAVVTSSDSTYTTTYATSLATTYTTAASQTLAVQSSTSSNPAQQTSANGANKGAVMGAYGVAGFAVAFALGML